MLPLYGITELVDENDQPITSPGIEGEIIGTSLNNFAMPFIRYRTGDRGVFARWQMSLRSTVCETRESDWTKAILYSHVNWNCCSGDCICVGQHFNAFERIRGMQLVQNDPGKLVVRIVRDGAYSQDDETEIRHRMQSSVDEGLQVVFEYLEILPVNKAGKVDFVIQNCIKNVGVAPTDSNAIEVTKLSRN